MDGLMKKFQRTGSVLDISTPSRSVTGTDQNIMNEMSEILVEDRQTLTRRMSLQLSISQISIERD